jgi:diguanylate cyclase
MQITRDSDVVARYGGDEFVIILPGILAPEVRKLLHRLQLHFQDNPMGHEKTSIPISISFGVASITDPGTEDPEALMRRADAMLLENKKRKKTGE